MSSVQPDKGPTFITPEKIQYLPDVIRDDTPKNRIIHMSSIGHRALYEMIPVINHLVADAAPFAAGRTGEIIVKSVRENGLHSTLGIDYHSDLWQYIFPYAATLTREVAHTDLDDDEKLRRIANMTGVMIAEAQSFTSGNKRTARAMYGRIRYGRDGIVRAHNEDIDFEPPETMERLVMLQNVAKLRAERNGAQLPEVFGGIYIDSAIEQSLLDASESLNAFRFRYGKSDVKGIGDADWNIYRLRAELESRIYDQRIRGMLVAVLFQEDYGPATCSLVFDSPCDIFEELNTENVVEILNTNRRLLRMRLMSFMAGVACGGYFVSIEDSAEEDKARQIVKTKWEPMAQPYVPKPQVPSEDVSTVNI